ncbi:DUF2059 domain-containing protein [Sulfitobacter sp. S190]|uniref:DUF2059 domain-containing protein n=1 Tax=Sulfitobacter sp. S190 TaxID=2867022 RepID=UPI0021A9536F|nr:DUF2059 domain-containing protein [Sulfitobacter sp. S190]UWR23966.1 DUF2059 domain-containing protein [Sulfitobacter sp. S190]
MRFISALCFLLTMGVAAFADARHTVLMDVMRIDELSVILSGEGQVFADNLNTDWLAGQGGAGWQQFVDDIYDPAKIAEGIRAGIEPALEGAAVEEAIAFYATDLGQQVISLENSARAAMADPDIEAAARDAYTSVAGTDDPRIVQIDRMIAAGDLVNRNVTSALNSNYQFLRALVDGDVYALSDAEILEDVQSERDEITADTANWLGAFLLLAYSPLSLEDLTRYAEFAQSDAGMALNAGIFAGFDPLYADISYALGRALALNMTAEEL